MRMMSIGSFISFMYGFLKAEAPFLQEPPWLYEFSPSPGPSGLCSYLLHLFDDSALSRLPSTCREKRLFPPALPSPPVRWPLLAWELSEGTALGIPAALHFCQPQAQAIQSGFRAELLNLCAVDILGCMILFCGGLFCVL